MILKNDKTTIAYHFGQYMDLYIYFFYKPIIILELILHIRQLLCHDIKYIMYNVHDYIVLYDNVVYLVLCEC